MDIMEKINDIVSKVKADKDFASKFLSNPIQAVESVLGIDLPDDQINAIIDGVKAKISVDKVGDALGAFKKLF